MATYGHEGGGALNDDQRESERPSIFGSETPTVPPIQSHVPIAREERLLCPACKNPVGSKMGNVPDVCPNCGLKLERKP
jgi:hypothetical protein